VHRSSEDSSDDSTWGLAGGLGDWGLAGSAARAVGLTAQRGRRNLHQQQRRIDSLVESAQEHSPALHPFDSYAIRTLLLHQPQRIHKLSGVMPGRGRYVQRVLVEGGTGEESVLTLTLGAVKGLTQPLHGDEGRRNGRGGGGGGGGAASALSSSAPTADTGATCDHGGGSGAVWPLGGSGGGGGAADELERCWRLMYVRGEPRIESLPSALSPEFCPEAVVASQLEALRRRDVDRAYGLLSRSARAQLGGPTSLAGALSSRRPPYYCELFGLGRAQTLRRVHSSSDTYLELVALEPGSSGVVIGGGGVSGGDGGDAALWCWVLQLQRDGDTGSCWAIDAVVKVHQDEM